MTTGNELPPRRGEAHFDSVLSDELEHRFIETLNGTADYLGFFAKPDSTGQKIIDIRFGSYGDCELTLETAASRGITTTTITYKDPDYRDKNFAATNSSSAGPNWNFTTRALGEAADTTKAYGGKSMLEKLGQYWPRTDSDTAETIGEMVADKNKTISPEEIVGLLGNYCERRKTGSYTDTSTWITYGHLGSPHIQRPYQQIFQLSASSVRDMFLNTVSARYVALEVVDGHSRPVTYTITKDELDDLSITATCRGYGTDSEMSLAVQDYDKVYQNLRQLAEQTIREKPRI